MPGRYRTPNGTVTSEWHRSGQQSALGLEVPVGSTATVRLPGRSDSRVSSGRHRFTTTVS
ncbi:alpha-L-rhamnosidase C-terminal domain-containing protein [Streptomyces bungoensis]|uniref:alpha-L-rhamnosidase C-terminal domain-containing protein n=1 Tax=Streptomyces bungoensis TaxID=285568 RepID=UPI003414FB3C